MEPIENPRLPSSMLLTMKVKVLVAQSCLSLCDCIDCSLEKAMAPYSSTLAWKIPWTEEPGGLQSMGSLRVGHDWATSLSLFTYWRRKWQPTPVFLPGESQGWGEPGGLLSLGSHRVGHDWSDLAVAADCSPPVLSLHGIPQGRAIPISRRIFPTQELNLGPSHCRPILYHLSHQGSLLFTILFFNSTYKFYI